MTRSATAPQSPAVDATRATRTRAGWMLLAAATVALLVVVVAVNWPAKDVLPAGDDFAGPLFGLRQGNELGPLSFFTAHNQAQNYRPLQQVTAWLAAGSAIEHPYPRLVALNIVSLALYAAVMLLWIRASPLDRPGAVVALVVFMLHPVNAAITGGVDNFSVYPAVAFAWLGAWCMLRWRDRLAVALPAAAACLVVGSLYKEYTFFLVPLAPLVLLVFRDRRRLLSAALAVLVLGLVGIAILAVRKLGMPEGTEASIPRPRPDVGLLVRNLALYAGALSYFGDTTWLFVRRTPAVLALAAASAAATVALIGLGLALLVRNAVDPGPGAAPAPEHPAPPVGGEAGVLRWIVFVLPALLASTLPNSIVLRVSEVYVPATLLPFALLAGLAAMGIARCGRPVQLVAVTVLVLQLGLGMVAWRSKVNGLVESGRRAQRIVDAAMRVLPADIDGRRIAMVYRADQVRRVPSYSIFSVAEDRLVHDVAFLERERPDAHVEGAALVVDEPSQVDADAYDIVIVWDMDQGTFERVKPPYD